MGEANKGMEKEKEREVVGKEGEKGVKEKKKGRMGDTERWRNEERGGKMEGEGRKR